MNTPIGITTVKRPGVSYLNDVLGQIAEIPVAPPVVVAQTMPGDLDGVPNFKPPFESLPPILGEAVECCEARNNLRCLETNADRLIAHLAERHEVFLVLQDDVLAAPCAYERINQVADWLRGQPRVAWISFYTPYGEAGACPYSLWRYQANHFYGDVAVLWRADAAREFLPNSRPGTAHDLMMQEWFSQPAVARRWLTFGHSPCMFQHVGVKSATNHEWRQRTTMNFHPRRHAIKAAKPFPRLRPA